MAGEWRKIKKKKWVKERRQAEDAKKITARMHASRMLHLEHVREEINKIKQNNPPKDALRILTNKLTESEKKLAILEHFIEEKSLPSGLQAGDVIHLQDVIHVSEILQDTIESAENQGKINLAMAKAENRLYKLAVMELTDIDNLLS